MLCPLLAITDHRVGREGWPQGCDCIQAECAWWLEDLNICAIRDLAWETMHTQLRLSDLQERFKRG